MYTLSTVLVLFSYIHYPLYRYFSRTYTTHCTGTVPEHTLPTAQVLDLYKYTTHCTGTVPVYTLSTVLVLFSYIHYPLYRYFSRTYTTHCTGIVPLHTLPTAQVMFPYIALPTAKVLFPYISLFQHILMLDSYFNLNSSLLLTLLIHLLF